MATINVVWYKHNLEFIGTAIIELNFKFYFEFWDPFHWRFVNLNSDSMSVTYSYDSYRCNYIAKKF